MAPPINNDAIDRASRGVELCVRGANIPSRTAAAAAAALAVEVAYTYRL